MSHESRTADIDPRIAEDVHSWLSKSPGDLTPHRVATALRQVGGPVGDAAVLRLFEMLKRECLGYGVLQDLMEAPEIASVAVRGLEVYVRETPDREAQNPQSTGFYLDTEQPFDTPNEVRRLAQRLAASATLRLDDGQPFAETRLSDGVYFRAYLGAHGLPLTMVLDKHYEFTYAQRVRLGLLTREAANFLEQVERQIDPI